MGGLLRWLALLFVLAAFSGLGWIALSGSDDKPAGTGYTQVEDIGELDFQDALENPQFPVQEQSIVQKRPHQYRLVLGAFSNPDLADQKRFEALTSGVTVGIEESEGYWRVVTEWYDSRMEVDRVVSRLLEQNVESEMETRILER